MTTFTITTLAGTVLVELPLDDAALGLVAGDLLQRLPPPDGAGMPRLLLGPRELGWCERLADLALAPGTVMTLVLVPDSEQAATDLMGADGTPVRLAAARALRAMGAAAAMRAEELANAVLSDPAGEVVGEALQALRDMGAAVEPGSMADWLSRIAQLALDLEDPRELCGFELQPRVLALLIRQLEALLARCDASPGQAALRRRTVLRRLAPLDPEGVRRHEPLLADPLEDSRPEVRLAAVAVLGSTLLGRWQDRDDACCKLCGLVAGDASPNVQTRAAAIVVRAHRHFVSQRLAVPQPLDAGLELAHTRLAAEVEEALQRSAESADHCRMQVVHSIQQLLG